jgi:hypothetical protein
MGLSPLLTALLGIFFQFGIWLVIVWAVTGVPVMFGGRRMLRGAPILIIAGLLTVPTVVNQFQAIGQASTNQVRDGAEAERLNDAFALAMSEWASREAVESVVVGLSPKAWNPSTLGLVISAIQLKAERYNDLNQSSLLSRVVKTDVQWDPLVEAAMRERDERAWTPLIEAAARGGSVTLPSGSIDPGEEMMTMAWSASRALALVLESLESLHRVSVPLTSAARELTPTLDWFAHYVNAPSGTQQSIGSDLARVNLLVTLGAQDVSASIRTVPLYVASPETVESFLFFSWAQEYVGLYTERWLAGAAMYGHDSSDMTQLNEYRRFLGLPVILEDDILAARQDGLLPYWAEQPVGGRLGDYLDSREQAIDELNESFAALAPTWTIPSLSLP